MKFNIVFALIVFYLIYDNLNFYDVSSSSLSKSQENLNALEREYERFLVYYRKMKKKLKKAKSKGFKRIVMEALPTSRIDNILKLTGSKTSLRSKLWGLD